MKQRIRLNEADLHRIVKESVNRVLKEGKVVNNKGNDMKVGKILRESSYNADSKESLLSQISSLEKLLSDLDVEMQETERHLEKLRNRYEQAYIDYEDVCSWLDDEND